MCGLRPHGPCRYQCGKKHPAAWINVERLREVSAACGGQVTRPAKQETGGLRSTRSSALQGRVVHEYVALQAPLAQHAPVPMFNVHQPGGGCGGTGDCVDVLAVTIEKLAPCCSVAFIAGNPPIRQTTGSLDLAASSQSNGDNSVRCWLRIYRPECFNLFKQIVGQSQQVSQ